MRFPPALKECISFFSLSCDHILDKRQVTRGKVVLFCSVLPVRGYSQSITVGKVGQQEWVEGGVTAGA